jgi:hypothetical protein
MQSPVVALLAGLLGIGSAALAESFAVRESSLLFVDPPVEAPTGPEGAEAGADQAFYRDAAERFAQRNGLQVSRTKAPTLLFERLGAKPIRLKNTAGPGGDAYFYDGKNPPKKIESLATLDDGKEFQRYFGRPARAKP